MKSTEKLIQEKVKALEEENKKLKDTINKAKKYIEKNLVVDFDYLLKILKGE